MSLSSFKDEFLETSWKCTTAREHPAKDVDNALFGSGFDDEPKLLTADLQTIKRYRDIAKKKQDQASCYSDIFTGGSRYSCTDTQRDIANFDVPQRILKSGILSEQDFRAYLRLLEIATQMYNALNEEMRTLTVGAVLRDSESVSSSILGNWCQIPVRRAPDPVTAEPSVTVQGTVTVSGDYLTFPREHPGSTQVSPVGSIFGSKIRSMAIVKAGAEGGVSNIQLGVDKSITVTDRTLKVPDVNRMSDARARVSEAALGTATLLNGQVDTLMAQVQKTMEGHERLVELKKDIGLLLPILRRFRKAALHIDGILSNNLSKQANENLATEVTAEAWVKGLDKLYALSGLKEMASRESGRRESVGDIDSVRDAQAALPALTKRVADQNAIHEQEFQKIIQEFEDEAAKSATENLGASSSGVSALDVADTTAQMTKEAGGQLNSVTNFFKRKAGKSTTASAVLNPKAYLMGKASQGIRKAAILSKSTFNVPKVYDAYAKASGAVQTVAKSPYAKHFSSAVGGATVFLSGQEFVEGISEGNYGKAGMSGMDTVTGLAKFTTTLGKAFQMTGSSSRVLSGAMQWGMKLDGLASTARFSVWAVAIKEAIKLMMSINEAKAIGQKAEALQELAGLPSLAMPFISMEHSLQYADVALSMTVTNQISDELNQLAMVTAKMVRSQMYLDWRDQSFAEALQLCETLLNAMATERGLYKCTQTYSGGVGAEIDTYATLNGGPRRPASSPSSTDPRQGIGNLNRNGAETQPSSGVAGPSSTLTMDSTPDGSQKRLAPQPEIRNSDAGNSGKRRNAAENLDRCGSFFCDD